MSEDIEELPPAARIIRERREAKGLSQEDLAELVGTNQQTIDKIEKGVIKKSSFLPRLSQELDVSLSELIPALSKQPGRVLPGTKLVGEKDLPVHGASSGREGAFILSDQPVDWVARPEPLSRVQNAYGIIVIDDAMIPQFWLGDVALVHPHLPPMAENACVFYSRKRDEVTATIRYLRRITQDAWHVSRWHPLRDSKKEAILKRSEWQTCHVIVGSYKG